MNKKQLFLSALLLTGSFCSFADTPATDKTLATVNGVAITKAELDNFMSKLKQPVAQERALQELVNVELLVQEAKNQKMLEDKNLMLELKRTRSALIAAHFLQQQLLNMNLTEDTLKARYQKDYVDGKKVQEYNANHILLKTEEEAKDVIKQLDNGDAFTELAKKLSTGPSGKNGGALGWFKSSDMVAPFSKAAMELEVGKYSKQPVKTQFGWHVIMLNDSRDIDPPTFESVKQQISSAIAGEKISAIMAKLKDAATIEMSTK